MPAPYNRATVTSFADRYGKFVSHPATQGTAMLAPVALAMAPMLMSGGEQQAPPQHVPMHAPMHAPQGNPTARGEAQPQMTRYAALGKAAMPVGAIFNALGNTANIIGAGAQVVGALRSPKPPKAPPGTAGPAGSEPAKLSAVRPPAQPAVARPVARATPRVPLPAPGASNAFTAKAAPPKSPGMSGLAKASSFGGAVKSVASDFGAGARDHLAAGLNTFLTPTTAYDPQKMRSVDDSTTI